MLRSHPFIILPTVRQWSKHMAIIDNNLKTKIITECKIYPSRYYYFEFFRPGLDLIVFKEEWLTSIRIFKNIKLILI